MSEKRKYDSTVARIAGNIASGLTRELLTHQGSVDEAVVARECVSLARAIVAEVERTGNASENAKAPAPEPEQP